MNNLIYKAIEKIVKKANFYIDSNNRIIWRDKRPQPTREQIEARIKELELEEKIEELISRNNKEFDKRINQLTLSYPEREVLTWDKQEQEARAYLADKKAVTPLLDNLSKSRGIEKKFLAQKIIEKADAYASEVGSLLGKRQKIEDLINSKTTIEELEQLDIEGLWNE